MNERDLPLPLTFRRELMVDLMAALRAGECCSLIGTSGSGKSNLVRFLQQPEVQVHYWGEDAIWIMPVDVNGLVFGERPDEYMVAELMIHHLIRAAERRQLAPDLIEDFNQKYTHLVGQPSALLALRYLERICGRLIEGMGVHLVFAFDQFEDLWQRLEPRLFLNLRHLRDKFKYRLSYLVLTRERLARTRQRTDNDLKEVEAFCELFSAHTFGLGMYNDADASFMLERIARRSQLTLSDSLRTRVVNICGGHPALLRAVFWALHTGQAQSDDISALLAIATVAEECAKIWNDLRPEEQHAMRTIAKAQSQVQPDSATLDELRLKQLIRDNPPMPFSHLFATYACSCPQGNMAGVVVAPRLQQVWVDGIAISEALTPYEFRLIEYLARHAGQRRTREEILQHLYGEASSNKNDERLDSLVSRLRKKLGEDAKTPRYLITHPGVGFRLSQGRIQE